MLSLPPISLRIRGHNFAGRVVFVALLLLAIFFGAAAGLAFVYSNDLPQVRALEDYRPSVVTELIPMTASPSPILPCSAAFCLPGRRFPRF
jgi:hypothetical protein